MPPHQLPLDIRLRDGATFDNYLAGPNAEALAAVRGCLRGDGVSPVYLWGGAGCGKSHLLQAACREAGGLGRSAAYLPLRQVREWPPEMLGGLERTALVCLDDVEAVAGSGEWEEALFHLFNRCRAAGAALIAAGSALPDALGLRLPDLRSRLVWGVVYSLQELDDAAKLTAVQRRARNRGLELSDEVGLYLLRRYPRDMGFLFALLERLDRASLAAQRRLTIPFVKDVLGTEPP